MTVTVADTSFLLAVFDRAEPEHERCQKALATVNHLVVSPIVLAELDYLISQRRGSKAALQALEAINRQVSVRRYAVPEVEETPHRLRVSPASLSRDRSHGRTERGARCDLPYGSRGHAGSQAHADGAPFDRPYLVPVAAGRSVVAQQALVDHDIRWLKNPSPVERPRSPHS